MKALLRFLGRGEPARVDASRAQGEALVQQGIALEDKGDYAAAHDLYRRAIELSPQLADAHFNLGNALNALGRPGEALRAYRRAIELQPDNIAAHLNLGATLLRSNNADAAEQSYREALRLRPQSANAWTGLGCALEMKSALDEAASAFEQALGNDPAHEGAASRLAQALRARGGARGALAVLDGALSQCPDSVLLLRTRADICGGAGEYADAIAGYRRILALAPHDGNAASNLLWTLNFVPEATPDEILDAHRAFGARLEQSVERLPARVPRPLQRRLRIGYVSPDFCRHSVSCFIEPLLRAHDRSRFEIHCFHDHPAWDDVTERIYKSSERWHEVAGTPDAEVARLVVDNDVDILVDLAGHSAHNRMRLFALKPAPLQFTWLGYLCTTGLSAIDYRICDRHTDPAGVAEAWQVERPARLPDSQWCYQPQVGLPAPSPLPLLANGYCTFGSFNQESKLSAPVLSAWAGLLAAIPHSRLRIFGVSCDMVEERIRACMAGRGVAAERLDLLGRIPIDDYFAAYRDIDIALDTFPYNGATTSCDALIMGVPVATVAGHRAIARGGVSLLTTLGLSDWIAPSPEGLAGLLRSHIAEPGRLAALRAGLPTRLRASPLMDAARFARNMETLFQQEWEHACAARDASVPG